MTSGRWTNRLLMFNICLLVKLGSDYMINMIKFCLIKLQCGIRKELCDSKTKKYIVVSQTELLKIDVRFGRAFRANRRHTCRKSDYEDLKTHVRPNGALISEPISVCSLADPRLKPISTVRIAFLILHRQTFDHFLYDESCSVPVRSSLLLVRFLSAGVTYSKENP